MSLSYVRTDSYISLNSENSQNCLVRKHQEAIPCFVFGADREGLYLKGQTYKRSTTLFVERTIDFLGSNK